jgi:hypothetical protein
MRSRACTLVLSLLLSACGDPTHITADGEGSPTGAPQPVEPAGAVADGTVTLTQASAAAFLDGRFTFLPPLPALPTTGDFDAGLLDDLAVQVCIPAECGTQSMALFTSSGGTSSVAITLDAGLEQYQVNWHTGDHDLSGSRLYRIRVLVLGLELGYADVEVVSTGKELKDLATGATIGLVDGRTLPVKFQLRRNALVDAWRLARGGAAADEVATMLEATWSADLSTVVQLLALVGFPAPEVGAVLRVRYGQDASEALAWLQGVELVDGPREALEALTGAGYPLSEVVALLVGTFDLTAAELAEILSGAGYSIAEIAAELEAAFGSTPAEIAAILAGLGYTATDVGDWLLGEVPASTPDPVVEVATVLAGAGFPFDEVAAWVGANTADSGEAAGALRDAGYTADLVIVYLHVTLGNPVLHAIGDLAGAGYTDAEVVQAATSSTDASLAEVGEGVVDAYAIEETRLADLFEDVGAAAGDAAAAVMEVFDLTLTETLEAFRQTGFPVDHLAEFAWETIGDVPGRLGQAAEAMRLGLGVSFDRVKDWLRGKARDVNELLEAAGLSGYSAGEIASFLYDTAGASAEQIMEMAARYGIPALEMVEAMAGTTSALVGEIAAAAAAAYDLAAAELGALLQQAGYGAAEVYQGVAEALDLSVAATIEALKDLGMAIEEVAGWALAELEKSTADALEVLGGILLGAGYGAEVVIDVVLGGAELAVDAFLIFHNLGIDVGQAVRQAIENGADPGEIFDAVVEVLGTGLEDAVALLEGAGIPAGVVLAWLSDRLQEQTDFHLEQGAQILMAAGYAAEAVVDAVFGAVGFGVEAFRIFTSIGGDMGMAVRRALDAGASPGEVFDAAMEALGGSLQDAADLLRSAGVPVDAVGAWLAEQLQGQVDLHVDGAAEILLAAGYAKDAVAGFVLGAVGGSAELAAGVLRRVGYSAGEVVDFLRRVAGRSKAVIAGALEAAGYGARESIVAMKGFASTTALEAAGFLRDVWGVSKEVVASILSDAAYGLGEIIDALLALFTWAGDELVNLMVSLGFALGDILAILGS